MKKSLQRWRKAEADADRVLDDLNAIASAASHEELAQAGELARERERVREKEAARSRNLTGGGTKATSKKEKGKSRRSMKRLLLLLQELNAPRMVR
jgi:hypothetical protein